MLSCQIHICHLSQYSLFGSLRPVVLLRFQGSIGDATQTLVREAYEDAPDDATSRVVVVQLDATSSNLPAGGLTYTLNGTGSFDPDGVIESYWWDHNLTSSTSTGAVTFADRTASTTTVTITKGGVHTLSMTATDDNNATRVRSLVVVLNRPPTATAAPATAAVVHKGGATGPSTTVTATATDPDEPAAGEVRDPRDELYAHSYVWTVLEAPVALGSVAHTPQGDGKSLRLTGLSVGTYRVRVDVTDAFGVAAPPAETTFEVVLLVPAVTASPTFMLASEQTSVALDGTGKISCCCCCCRCLLRVAHTHPPRPYCCSFLG